MYLSEEKNDKLFSWKSWSKNELCPKNILLLNFIYQDFRRRKRTSRKTTGTSLCIFIAQTLAEKSQSICIKKKLDLKSAMKRAEPDKNRKRKNVFLSSWSCRINSLSWGLQIWEDIHRLCSEYFRKKIIRYLRAVLNFLKYQFSNI